jgi:hypothetical protein
MKLSNIPKYADILAIPCWILMTYYFLSIEKTKTVIENLLLLFGITGFILDTVFTLQFIT